MAEQEHRGHHEHTHMLRALLDGQQAIIVRLGALDKRLTNLRRKIVDLSTNEQAAFTALTDTIDTVFGAIQASNATLTQIVADDTATIAALQAQVGTDPQVIADLTASRDALQAVVDGNEAAVDAAVAAVQTHVQTLGGATP